MVTKGVAVGLIDSGGSGAADLGPMLLQWTLTTTMLQAVDMWVEQEGKNGSTGSKGAP